MNDVGPDLVLAGGNVLDVVSGQVQRRDVAVSEGLVVARAHPDARTVDVSGLTVVWGLWDCHAHPGSLMYDPPGDGFFESVATRTIRAGENLRQALRMGVTGVRALGEASDIDLAWAAAIASGQAAGPRLLCAGQAIRITGGHGTSWPRRPLHVEDGLVADGPWGMATAVRSLAERGADWVKLLLTGGLFSPHETVDGAQFDDVELDAALAAARQRGLPVAAHCGSARVAERFAAGGGRSVEHGYALDERAAAAMASAGTFLVPTIGVTSDVELMQADGWPEHARRRALEANEGHVQSLGACREAGVAIATGADLNPIGPRLHAELALLQKAGMSRHEVLVAATVGGRRLAGLGAAGAPWAGAAADLLAVDGDPLSDLRVLRDPSVVVAGGRLASGGASDSF